MKKKDDSIAVIIQNYIQYLSIMPGIDELIKLGYNVDIYGEKLDNDEGFSELLNDAIEMMRKKGYKVYTEPQDKTYKILLDVYDTPLNLKYKYRIKYRYGLISSKPDRTLVPSNYLKYDCVICAGPYDSKLIGNYTHTVVIPDMKYYKLKKKKHNTDKKVLLYVPTYGEGSSIELVLEQLAKLRKDYYVIAKLHHGTCFLYDEKERNKLIHKAVDECYDLHKELKDLFEIADVVLSDNSSALFEGIYNGIPTCACSEDLNQNKLGDFNTFQYTLYKDGILPYTNNPKNLKKIIEEAQSKEIYKKQQEWNNKTFDHTTDPIKAFVSLIDNYLNDNIDMESFMFHRFLFDAFKELQNKNAELVAELNDYKKGKLYNVATKIYKIENKVKK